uniref:Uncharacterized protein n=1 Tax=Oryza punctata TaxID=4537 RepID=A0A0E0M914_ORYPU
MSNVRSAPADEASDREKLRAEWFAKFKEEYEKKVAEHPDVDWSDELAVDARAYRENWEWLYARAYGPFDKSTSIPPMRYTAEPVPLDASEQYTLQIFCVKIKESSRGLQWPIHVFGLIAARDTIDHNRNMIFNRTRDDCQILTQEVPYLLLTGPTRAVVVCDPVYFEVVLKVKGSTESEDEDLSFLTVPLTDINRPKETCLITREYTSKLSTLELTFGYVVRSVEATIKVRVIDGSWSDGSSAQFTAHTASINHHRVLLLNSGDKMMPVNTDHMIELTRRVVSVELEGELKVSVVAFGCDGSMLEADEGFRPKETDSADCKMNSKRRRSHSPVEHMEGNSKEIDISGRKDDSRDLENDTSNARSGRGHEYVRHSDRHSSGAPRDSRRHDDYRRYHDKRAHDNDRGHRTSRSEWESRADTYYDRTKRDGTSDRSRGDWRNDDEPLRREHRSKNQDKQEPSREYPRYDGEHDKYSDGRKQGHTSRRYPEEKESKYKETAKQEEALKNRSGKEIEKRSSIAEPEVGTREKRSLFSSVGPDFENAQLNEKADTSGKKPSHDCSNGGVLDNPASGFTVNSVDAAKVAAMKAAELVNKNLVGFGVGAGRLSTDQKKKLLWGNKKSNPPESSTHWDSNMFSDRERQEKFNKLMGVKSSNSSIAQEGKVDSKDGSSSDAKKQEELDTDLEKHYIAGLRRRDGRTVGLGL